MTVNAIGRQSPPWAARVRKGHITRWLAVQVDDANAQPPVTITILAHLTEYMLGYVWEYKAIILAYLAYPTDNIYGFWIPATSTTTTILKVHGHP